MWWSRCDHGALWSLDWWCYWCSSPNHFRIWDQSCIHQSVIVQLISWFRKDRESFCVSTNGIQSWIWKAWKRVPLLLKCSGTGQRSKSRWLTGSPWYCFIKLWILPRMSPIAPRNPGGLCHTILFIINKSGRFEERILRTTSPWYVTKIYG